MIRNKIFSLLCGATLAMTTGLFANAQEIAKLYAPQAPAGSSYVRVVNASGKNARIEFVHKTDTLDAHKIVTDYRVVNASGELQINVNGTALVPVKITPDSFNTIILDRNNHLNVIVDTTENRNDLKAELRFYNIVPTCHGALALENGPVIFEQTNFGESKKRTINPVKANVIASCDTTSSKPYTLPPLKSGDRTSIFLIGDSKQPRLIVQLDATEPYSGPR